VARTITGLPPEEKRAILETARKGSSKVTAKVVKEIARQRHPKKVRLKVSPPRDQSEAVVPAEESIAATDPDGPVVEASWRDRIKAAVGRGEGCTLAPAEAVEVLSLIQEATR
jgi:hypothetical protein